MIYTSSHKDWQSTFFKTYAISGNRGKDVSYNGRYYSLLAPKKEFWQIWHNNIGIIPDDKNNKYYIEEYFKQVLIKLDPIKVYNELDDSALLCYESYKEFCHRHIVSAWFELFLNKKVDEAKSQEYKVEVVKNLEIKEQIKKDLEETIKNNVNMHGFHSLRALYLFQKAQLEDNNNLKLEAELEENRYREKELLKIRKKEIV